jgi:5'-deoxynucleotidase YfbR-like HD superfamily hydrolase
MFLNKSPEIVIGTHSGKLIDVANLSSNDIDIEDIAHTLSLLCRWGGHCLEFYSVAEHSVRCSYKASKKFKLEALLHDASEAYLVDIPRPIKRNLPDYQRLEQVVEKAISEKFNLPFPTSKEVKIVDNRMLETERRDITVFKEKFLEEEPFENKILPWSPKSAKKIFLETFKEFR